MVALRMIVARKETRAVVRALWMPREEWMSWAMRIQSAVREMLTSALLLRTIVFAVAGLSVGMSASAMDTRAERGMSEPALAELPSDGPSASVRASAEWRQVAPDEAVVPDGFRLLAIPHAGTPLAGLGESWVDAGRLGDLAARPDAVPGPAGIHVCGLMPPEGSLLDDGMARVLATRGQLFGASEAALTTIVSPHIRVEVPVGVADAFLADGFVPPVPVPPG